MNKEEYIVGNAKDIKKIFDKHNVSEPQLIISSPPYFDVKNYEDHKDQIGYGQEDYEKYLDDVAKVYQDCYDLSNDTSSFWLIIDSFKKDGELQTLPFDIKNKLKQRNKKTWILKEIIIWDKEKGLPWNGNGNFKNEFEYILFFTKNDDFKFHIDSVREINDLKKWWLSYPERYNPKGKAPSNLWTITTPLRGWGNGKQNHLCPFPYLLSEKIISIASDIDDLVFDPFAGSGSGLAIAELMGRQVFGIDINKKYKELYEKEVKFGAKAYWEKRTKEIEMNTSAILDFSSTNKKLRKLKVGSSIANYINDKNSYKFLHFLIENGEELKMLTLENSFRPDIEFSDNDKLQKLIKQSKTLPTNQVVTEKELKDFFSKTTILYKYNLKKFYTYRAKIKFSATLDGLESRPDFIYSNIELKIY